MTVIKKSAMGDMPKGNAERKFGYRSQSELIIRETLDTWMRARWPDRRIINELVIASGTARADMAAIGEDDFAVVEIKGPQDVTTRLIHQMGYFRLASPELWLVVADTHEQDAELMHYLLPTIGVAVIRGLPEMRSTTVLEEDISVDVTHEPGEWTAHGMALLSVLWVDELKSRAAHYRCAKLGTHKKLVNELDAKLTPDEKLTAVATELLRRDFIYRSDAPEWAADAVS